MSMRETRDVRSTGADVLVDSLIAHGVDAIFGVPGDTGVNLYDAIGRRSSRIRHLLARDERHAAYMADGYARTSGRVAVCEASSGAGAVYLASGLAEAFASSVPMLAITTDIHRASRGSNAITEIDQEALFSAVTKWRAAARCADDVPALVAEAFDEASTGRPAPVALVFPEDVLDELTLQKASSGSSTFPRRRPLADRTVIMEAARLLRDAKQPAILAGGGVHASGAYEALLSFAELSGIPVATTIHGKGALPEQHPLSLGVNGANGSRGYSNSYLEGADVVMVVGSRANATDTDGFTAPNREDVHLIHVEIDPHRGQRRYSHRLDVVGDAAAVLRQLGAELEPGRGSPADHASVRIEAARHEWAAEPTFPSVGMKPGELHPRAVVETLRRVAGGDCWVVADPGTPTPHLAAYWETSGLGWRVVIPRGHGPMGYAISAAIGTSVAHPGERVLCMTTEGSLAMGVADFETAARLRLPITYVVLDNGSFAWIKMLQHLFMGKRYFQVDPGPIDPVLVAQGMGLSAHHVTSVAQLETSARASLGQDSPTVLHVRVPEHQDCPPPVSPWQRALADGTAIRPVY
jgi:acetolactate synthase-1/2/3 large subunit